jgi:hypothetical protein
MNSGFFFKSHEQTWEKAQSVGGGTGRRPVEFPHRPAACATMVVVQAAGLDSSPPQAGGLCHNPCGHNCRRYR